ncbi:MAG: hypothetical protein ACM3O4_05005 [Ignavibacteriales bacterium]
MKVDIKNENDLIVFLNNKYIENINFNDRNNLETYFRSLFLKLKNIYGINITGYYNINVYINEYFGVVLEMLKEPLECLDYYNSVDMQVNIIKDCEFLYQVNDFYDKYRMYFYKNKLYLRISKDISFIELGKLLENSVLVYGDIVDEILKYGKIKLVNSVVK